jgi:hypothetical protein
MTTAYASAADLTGKLAESLVSDVLADAAEIPGTPFCDPSVLAGFVRSMGEPDRLAFAAALCNARFRRKWADLAAPHPKFLRVPLLAAMAAGEAAMDQAALLADYEAAKAAAESGRPDKAWRIPDAAGRFPERRAAKWVRKFSRCGDERGEFGTGEFRGMVELATLVLRDRKVEAESLKRAMADRCWPFGGAERAELAKAAADVPAKALLAAWFREAGCGSPDALASHAAAKLEPLYGPWVGQAAHWVERTAQGAAWADVASGRIDGSLKFEASELAVPKVKALLRKLVAADAENRAAMAEFYDDAGADRSALMRSGT